MNFKKMVKRVDKNGKIKSIIKKSKFLRLNYTKLNSYLNKKRKSKIINKFGFEVLTDIHKILEKTDIQFFVDFGTLLGIVRDDSLIKYDLDMDIGVIGHYEIIINKIKKLLLANGFLLSSEFIYNGKTAELSYLYKGIKFDICFYDEDNLHSYCYLFYRDPDIAYYEDNTMSVVQMTYTKIKGIIKYKTNGIVINIPQNAERLLEEKYGMGWEKPDPKWVYWKAPCARKCKYLGTIKTN